MFDSGLVVSMRFMWLDKEKYVDQISFLKSNCEQVESIDPEILVYKTIKTTDGMLSEMKTLEKCGFIKIVKELNEMEGSEDVIPMTKRVEKIKSTPMYIKVFFSNTTVLLSESELLSSTAFRKYLLRENKFIKITDKQWTEIVQAWLTMATEIVEESEEEQVIDKVLNYLANCVIYSNLDKAISRNTLFFDEKDNGIVYCLTDVLLDIINTKRKNELSSRKLRAMLSEFVDGNSIQRRIFNSKYRFWRFKIEKTHIDFDKQLFVEEEDNEENNKDSGEAENGQDHLLSE